jgi:hypothetical protein
MSPTKPQRVDDATTYWTDVWAIVAGFMALCCAEGLACELTKKKHSHSPRSLVARRLSALHQRALLLAAKRLGSQGTLLNGYPCDRRLCDWWGPVNGATVGCCDACCKKYVSPVIAAREARARKVRINWSR